MWVFSMPVVGKGPMTGSQGVRGIGEPSDPAMNIGFFEGRDALP